MFLPHIRPIKHTEQDEIDAKWLGKELAFWRESWRVGKNIIIANKSINETENLSFSVSDWILFHRMNTTIGIFTRGFFQCKFEFYFTEWTPQAVFSRVAVATSENIDCGVHSVK